MSGRAVLAAAMVSGVLAAVAGGQPATAGAATRHRCHTQHGLSAAAAAYFQHVSVRHEGRARCVEANRIIDRVHAKASHGNWFFTVGTHRFRIPRRGGDYRCSLTVRKGWDKADQHPVGKMHGSCLHRHRQGTRFWFSGRYA